MSKIERSPFFDSLPTTDRRRKGREIPATSPRSFRKVLMEQAQKSIDDPSGEPRHQQEHDIQHLMERIKRMSTALQQKVTWSAVLEYREAIAQIVHTATRDMFHTERIISRQYGDTSKRFVLVKEIDSRMNEMVSQFLEHEYPRLRILELVGEINGLLVDLQS